MYELCLPSECKCVIFEKCTYGGFSSPGEMMIPRGGGVSDERPSVIVPIETLVVVPEF